MSDDLNAVMVESGVNPQGGAWVRMLTLATKTVMRPEEARDLALNLLRCAEAALTDKALAKIGQELLGNAEAGRMLIRAMRDAREDNLKTPEAQS